MKRFCKGCGLETMKRKDTIFSIIGFVISIIMVYSLIQEFFYEIGSIERKFWGFIFITSFFMIGSFGMILIGFIYINKLKENLKRKRRKYMSVILVYIAFFILVGTIISYEAISTFLGPEFFPDDVFFFLFGIEILVQFFSLGLLGVFFPVKLKTKTNSENEQDKN